MPLYDQVNATSSNKLQEVLDTSLAKQKQVDQLNLSFDEYLIKYGVGAAPEYTFTSANLGGIPPVNSSPNNSLFNTQNPVGFAGNLALESGTSFFEGLTALARLPAQAVQQGGLVGSDISQEQTDTFRGIRNLEDQYLALQNQIDASTDPIERARLRAEQRKVSPENLTESQRALLTPDASGTSPYDVLAQYDAVGERIDAINAPSEALRDRVDNRATERLIGEAKADFETNAATVALGQEQVAEGDYFLGLGNILGGSIAQAVDAVGTVITNPAATAQLTAGVTGDLASDIAVATLTGGGSLVAGGVAVAEGVSESLQEITDDREERQVAPATGIEQGIAVTSAVAAGLVDAVSERLIGGGKTNVITGGASEFVAEGSQSAITQYGSRQAIEEVDFAEAYAEGVAGLAGGAGINAVRGVPSLPTGTPTAPSEVESAINTASSPEATPEQTEEAFSKISASNPDSLDAVLTNATQRVATDSGDSDAAIAVAQATLESIKAVREIKQDQITQLSSQLTGKPEAEVKANEQVIVDLTKQVEDFDKLIGKHDVPLSSAISAKGLSTTNISDISDKFDLSDAALILANDPDKFGTDYKGFKSQAEVQQAGQAITAQIAKDPASVPASAVTTVLNSPVSKSLTAPQRASLEAHRDIEQLKTTADVANDVLNGDAEGKYRGLNQYLGSIQNYLNLGNISLAQGELQQLARFTGKHLNTAERAERAYRQFLDTGTPQKIKRANDLGFTDIGQQSVNLIPQIRQEADMLATATGIQERLLRAYQTAPTNEQVESNQITEEVNETVTPDPVELEVTTLTEPTPDQPEVSPRQETLDRVASLPEDRNLSQRTETLIAALQNDTLTDTGEASLNALLDAQEATEEVSPASGTVGLLESLQDANVAADYVYESKGEALPKIDQDFLRQNQVKKHYKVSEATGLLAQDHNLLNNLINATPTQMSNLLNREISSAEVSTLTAIGQYHEAVSGVVTNQIDAAIKATKGDATLNELFRFKRPIKFFLVDGALSEGVKAAISGATLNWMINFGKQSQLNTDDSIKELLNKKEYDFITKTQIQVLRNFGVEQDTVRDTLGKDILSTLGLKSSSIDDDTRQGIEASLGTTALNALIQLGMLEQRSASLAELNKLGGEWVLPTRKPNETDEQYSTRVPKLTSIRVPTTTSSAIANHTQILEALDGVRQTVSTTPDLLNDILAGTPDRFKATLGTPPPAITAEERLLFQNSDGQQVPAEMIEAANKYDSFERFVIEDMSNLIGKLGEEEFLRANGYRGVTEQDVEQGKIHSEDFPTLQGRDQTIAYDWQRLKEFKSRLDSYASEQEIDAFDVPFFTQSAFALQMRQQMQGKDINPQLSKMHRFVTGTKAEVIPLNDTQKLSQLKLAIAQSFGIKTDKLTSTAALQALETTLNDPTWSEPLKTVRKMLEGRPVTPAEKRAVSSLAASEEQTFTLSGMRAQVRLEQAIEVEAESLEIALPYEIDGVTNGVNNALFQLAMGTNSESELTQLKDLLNKGGQFFEDQGIKDYREYISDPSNLDMYQSLAKESSRLITDNLNRLSPQEEAEAKAVIQLMGSIGFADDNSNTVTVERNLTKNPLTITVYGSGDRAKIQKMGNDLIGEFYSQLTNYLQLNDAELETQRNAIQNLYTNLHLAAGRTKDGRNILPSVALANVPVTSLRKLIQSTKLEEFHRNAITRQVGKYVGGFVNEAITQSYEKVVNNTERVTKAMGIVHALSLPQFRQNTQKALSDARQEGTKSRYEGLVRSEYQSIKRGMLPRLPVLHTYFSRKEAETTNKDTLSKGIFVGNIGQVRTNRKGSESFTKVKGIPRRNLRGQETETLATVGAALLKERTFDSPSVGATPKSIIGNGDAATMNLAITQGDVPFLNVFDGYLANAGALDEGEVTLNTAHITAAKDYNLLSEVTVRLREAMQYAEQNDVLKSMNKSELEVLGKAFGRFPEEIAQIPQEELLEGLSAEMGSALADLSTAAQANYRGKQELFKNNTMYVDQFNGVGAGVQVTAGKVTAAKPVQPTQSIREEIQEAVQDVENSIPDQPVPSPSPDPVTPDRGEDSLLLSLINTESTPLRGVMETLSKELDQRDQGQDKYFSTLLKTLYRSVPTTAQVLSFDASAPVQLGNILSTQVWGYTDTAYTQNGVTAPTIMLGAKGTANHGFTLETFTHEVLHAALLPAIAKPNKEQQRYVDNIKKLRESVRDELFKTSNLNDNDLNTPFISSSLVNALGQPEDSIDEFVSWGLTNSEVRQVLADTKYTVKGASKFLRKVKDTILAFTDNLLGLLGITKSKRLYNSALRTLLANTNSILATDSNRASSPEESLTAEQRATSSVDTLSVSQIAESLSDIGNSGQHSEYLNTDLATAIEAVIDPALLQYSPTVLTQTTADQLLVERLDPDINHRLDTVTGLGFKLSDKEKFMYRAYKAVTHSALTGFSFKHRQLRRSFDALRKALKPVDFLPTGTETSDSDYSDKLTVATAKYRAIFGNPNVDHIANFLTMAKVSEEFRKVISRVPPSKLPKLRGKTFQEAVNSIWDSLVDFVGSILTGTAASRSVLSEVEILARNLTAIRTNQRSALANNLVASTVLPLTQLAESIRASLATKVNAVAANNTNALGRVATGISFAIDPQKTKAVFKELDSIHKGVNLGKQKVMSSIFNELRGTVDANKKIRDLIIKANQLVDSARNGIATGMAEIADNSFSTPLTDEQADAVTRGLLRTEAHVLLDHGYTERDALDMLYNSNKVTAEISRRESELAQVSGQNYHFYQRQSAGLGFHMATGGIAEEHQLFNPRAIARLFGVKNKEASDLAEVEPLIDVLSTLYALKFTNSATREALRQVALTEAPRGSDNGLLFAMNLHKKFVRDSLEKNFKGSENLVRKGYTKDITNPNKAIKIGSTQDEAEFRADGFTKSYLIGKDSRDKRGTDTFMYISDFAGDTSYLQGAASTLSLAAKGSNTFDLRFNANSSDPYLDAHRDVRGIEARSQQGIQTMFSPRTQALTNRNHLAPITDNEGNVVNYRYMMADTTKDALLERNNHYAEVIGGMFGAVEEKVSSTQINRELIDALAQQYETDKRNNDLRGYLELSSRVADQELRNLYFLIPQDARRYAKQKFGGNSILIRNDLLDTAFGYREASIRNAFKDNVPAWQRRLIVEPAKLLFGEDAARRLTQGEKGWKEFIGYLKDIVVIRSFVVTANNMISNTLQLVASGVPLKDAVSKQITAMRAAKDYRTNIVRIQELETLQEVKGNDTQRELELRRLETLQTRNPYSEYIEAGLLQNVVEGEARGVSRYSYGSKVGNFLEKPLAVLPTGVTDALKFILVAKGSSSYNVAFQMAQLGEFAAKATLADYLENTASNRLNRADAISRAANDFINYDIPLHKKLDYLQKVGLLWFPKYFLRVQKIIFQLIQSNPWRTLGLSVGTDMLGIDVSNIVDSSILTDLPTNRVGTPTRIFGSLGAHPVGELLL